MPSLSFGLVSVACLVRNMSGLVDLDLATKKICLAV